MAVQLEKPRRPVNVVLKSFARQAVTALRRNFATQRVFPYEVYPGYKAINERRKQKGQWYSTGEGFKSFQSHVISTPGNESIVISFRDYLRFVDMGVGQGRTYDEVRHDKKARYDKRYIAFWDTHDKETHRPSIMMEARHVQFRMQNYFEDYYGRELETVIYRTFSRLTPLSLNL